MGGKTGWTVMKALVRLRIAEAFSGLRRKNGRNGRSRSGAGGILLYVVLAVFVMLSLGTTFFGIALTLTQYGAMELYMPVMIILAFILCLIGSVFIAQHQIFEAKDNDAMFSLPIPPRMLLISRIISLILINFYYESMIAVPAAVVYGRVCGFSAPGLLFFILGAILMPLLAITLSMIIGYLIALISSKIRNSRMISLILSVAALLVYILFISTWTDKLEQMAGNGALVAEKLRRSIPPAWFFGDAVHNGSALSFLIFALICILPFAAACVVIGRNFVRIATSQKAARKVEYREGAMKARGSFSALARMEMCRFTGSNVYMLNSAIGLVFAVLAGGAAVFKSGELDEMLANAGAAGMEGMTGPLATLVFLALAAMVFISSATVSLDAYTMWQVRSLPVNGSEILLAKTIPHIIVSTPFLLAGTILIQFAMPMDAVWRAGVIVIPLIATVHNALLGVVVNLRFPKLDWLTEVHAVKQGLAPMLAMLLNAVPVMILIVCFGGLVIAAGLPPWVMLIVSVVLYTGLSAALLTLIRRWGSKRFAELKA